MGKRSKTLAQLGEIVHHSSCQQCGWSGSKTAARLHLKVRHSGENNSIELDEENKFMCGICGYCTNCKESISNHIKTQHTY